METFFKIASIVLGAYYVLGLILGGIIFLAMLANSDDDGYY